MNQLTCDKDPGIRQTSQPKTAGTKLPKGPIFRDEGDYLTLDSILLLCKRVLGKGSVQYYPEPLQEHIDFVTRITKSCVLATHGLHVVLQYSSQ